MHRVVWLAAIAVFGTDLNGADAHRYLALVHAAQSRPGLAVHAARRAFELAPVDPHPWSDLGRVHIHAGKSAEAIECFRRAVQLDPQYADGWYNLGTALKQTGDYESAFAALKNALLIDSTRDLPQSWRSAHRGYQFEDAVECFERASRHDPKMVQARSRLAQELSKHGKVKRAETLFRQSLGLNPDHVQGWFGLGRTLEDLGETDGALGCYLNVLRRRPGHPKAAWALPGLARGEIESDSLRARRARRRHREG